MLTLTVPLWLLVLRELFFFFSVGGGGGMGTRQNVLMLYRKILNRKKRTSIRAPYHRCTPACSACLSILNFIFFVRAPKWETSSHVTQHPLLPLFACCVRVFSVCSLKASNNSIAWRPLLDQACSIEGGE